MALHVSVLKPKFSKVLVSQSVHRNIEKVSLFTFLKTYSAIQYLDNITLSLVVTSRHDKKLTVPVPGFMQIYNSYSAAYILLLVL